MQRIYCGLPFGVIIEDGKWLINCVDLVVTLEVQQQKRRMQTSRKLDTQARPQLKVNAEAALPPRFFPPLFIELIHRCGAWKRYMYLQKRCAEMDKPTLIRIFHFFHEYRLLREHLDENLIY